VRRVPRDGGGESIVLEPADLAELRPVVLGILARRGVPRRDREDAAQEVLFAFWTYSEQRAIRPVEGRKDDGVVRTLLYAFTRNQAWRYREGLGRNRDGLGVEAPEMLTPDPHGRTVAREMLRRAADLPAPLARAVLLTAIGYTETDGANRLHIARGTYRKRLWQGFVILGRRQPKP